MDPAPEVRNPENDFTTQQLISLKDTLVRQARAKKGKLNDSGPEAIPTPTLDFVAIFALVLSTLHSSPAPSSTINPRLSPAILSIEIIHILLQQTNSLLSSANPAHPTAAVDHSHPLLKLYTPSFLLQLATSLYSVFDLTHTTFSKHCRASVPLLLALEKSFGGNAAAEYFKAQVLVSPWLIKRTLSSFHALFVSFDVAGLDEFSVAKTREESTASGILRRLTEGMALSDEIAVLSGKVAVEFVDKVWKENVEEGASHPDDFWIQPVLDGCRMGEKGRNNISLYLLTEVLRKKPSGFREIMKKGGFTGQGGEARSLYKEEDLESAIAILKTGNSLGLIEHDVEAGSGTSKEDDNPNKVFLPSTLLATCLYHSSNTLRCSALSLLVLSNFSTSPLPSSSFPLLRLFYSYSMGEEDGDFRMRSIALSGKLVLRLRDSSWKAYRVDPLSPYVTLAKEFIEWWFNELLFNLNPAKPFRIRITALRMLELLLQARLDSKFALVVGLTSPSGYSTYRNTTTSAVLPHFQSKHNNIDSTIANATSSNSLPIPTASGWPFEVPLVTARSTFILLRILLSTYTALRNLSIILLERFPAPLPGYEGPEGTARAKREILEPALKRIRSGREADSSAGAGILGLVWRKWVLEGEGDDWQLSKIGGWGTGKVHTGPLSFISSLMDLADVQILAYANNLGRAASTTPMHGTLLALRHLLVSLPPSLLSALPPNEVRAMFHRALGIAERVWDVTKVVLATSAPEGNSGAAIDTEEARALTFEGENGDEDTEMEEGGEEDADGTGGPMHKIVLSGTWRAMKENGELLETILRLPSELGLDLFESIWTLDDIERIGELFALWLARIRHRGAFMAIHPCYSRACEALLQSKDRLNVKKLPIAWLDNQLEALVSQKVSITRRSAGIPFCIIGILAVVLPVDRTAFNHAIIRLFDIAESKSKYILDESRVHAMNTLNTAFFDTRLSAVLGPYIERGFLLSISMFVSTNWICRNVAMIFYATLVSRAFGNTRVNLVRNSVSLQQRLGLADFSGRYPALHQVLLKELEFSSQNHLDDLPTSDLNSSLFSILMLLSLLQTANRIAGSQESLSDPFLPLVRACAKSRVWKIRVAAGDALTGLVSPEEVSKMCLATLEDVESCSENELHGRLVQTLRLLEAASPFPPEAYSSLTKRLDQLLPALLTSSSHSFPVQTTYLSISQVVSTSLSPTNASAYRSATVFSFLHHSLSLSLAWTPATGHLPSAEAFISAAYRLSLVYQPFDLDLIQMGLESQFMELRRESLKTLNERPTNSSDLGAKMVGRLLEMVKSGPEAPECRIAATEVLSKLDWNQVGLEVRREELAENISRKIGESVIIPVKEALLPFLATLADGSKAHQKIVLSLVNKAASSNASIESRTSAASSLLLFPSASKGENSALFYEILLRLLQDDDASVREIATEASAVTSISSENKDGLILNDRRTAEVVMAKARLSATEWMQIDEEELRLDLEHLSNPPSLLFAVEKPNIFKDELHETEYLLATHPPSPTADSTSIGIATGKLIKALESSTSSVELTGPLGLLGSEIACKWAYRLLVRMDLDSSGRNGISPEQTELVRSLRVTFVKTT